MSIRDELRAELKDALRAGDGPRKDVIRQVETEISVAKSEPGFTGDLDDALYTRVIAAYVKKMAKAQEEYEAAGERGRDLAAQLAFEVRYLSRWLPSTLSEEETRALVRRAMSEQAISDPRQAGKLVGALMKEHRGKLDGKLANRVAREELEKGAG